MPDEAQAIHYLGNDPTKEPKQELGENRVDVCGYARLQSEDQKDLHGDSR
jgi:hypothetical protein